MDANKTTPKLWWLLAAAALAAVLLVCCAGVGGVALWQWGRPGESGTVTLRHFQAIHEGMRYEEVVRIVGREGKEISRDRRHVMAGPGVRVNGALEQTYIWTNRDGSNLTCEFDDGFLVFARQNGLH